MKYFFTKHEKYKLHQAIKQSSNQFNNMALINETINCSRIVNTQTSSFIDLINSLRERLREERSTFVNTEDYMQLPPAEENSEVKDEDLKDSEDEDTDQDTEEDENTEENENTEEDENTDDDQDEDEEDTDEAKQEECKCMLEAECHVITGKPVCNLPENASLGECAICLEQIDQLINITSTRCGHSFHTSCLLRAITCGAGNCPNCRALLVVKEEEDNEDEYWTEYEDDEDDEEHDEESDEDDEEEIQVATLEQTAAKLQNLGYSVADILSLYLGNEVKSENQDRYRGEFFRKMMEDLDSVIDGRIPLSQRDTRSYLDVAKSSQT